MTITEPAESVHRTHSAMNQKVASMRTAGLVRTTAGRDARSKKIALTAKAKRVVDRLAADRASASTPSRGLDRMGTWRRYLPNTARPDTRSYRLRHRSARPVRLHGCRERP
jgi:DNA-binding MarR family transcriptional regulator